VSEESNEDLARRLPGYSWSLMRRALRLLALDGAEQVKYGEVGDCFDWDAAYPMLAAWCSGLGWVSPELQAELDRIDTLLGQLSDDKAAWTDEAIIGNPLWTLVRGAAGEALAMMPEQPLASQGG
jgi:hypothetical protein